MRSFRRVISLFVTLLMIMAFFMMPVSAGGYFSAGSSVFF